MNAWCSKKQNCPNVLTSGKSKYALDDTNSGHGGNQWRCYDPSTLNAQHTHYVSGKNYCTRDNEMRACLAACLAGQPCKDMQPHMPHLPEPPPARPLGNLSAVNVFWRTESAVTGEYYPCIRIPSVLLAGEKVLLAFAECRRTIGDGCEPKGAENVPGASRDICMKSSSDGGSTWSGLRVVAAGCNQPTAVWDAVTGHVILQGDCASHISQSVSQDLGTSWSEMRLVDSNFSRGAGSSAGPGVGLQLAATNPKAPGRLLFIGHHGAYKEDFIWYSDDHGQTYHLAETSLKTMDEAQLVELSNGDVMANMRDRQHHRGISISKDGGTSWGNVTYDSTLISPVCQASILRADGALFFSNPGTSKGRVSGTVRKSLDDGASWKDALHITDAKMGFAYSCLSRVPQPGKVGLLWETQCDQCDGPSCCSVFSVLPQSFTDSTQWV